MLLKNIVVSIVFLSGLIFSTGLLANEPLEFRAEESFIKFSGVQNKKTEFNGQFQSFEPIIVFNKNQLEQSSIRVNVDLASVESEIGRAHV